MVYFVGIDPSINSTGICVKKYDGSNKVSEYFVILKPGYRQKPKEKWLTKKEKIANESLVNFSYEFYNAEELNVYEDMTHFQEYWKSFNMINGANKVKDIVNKYTKDNPEKIFITIEGISYGSSIRTKSIYDLAGFNYLIREKFIEEENIVFTIATPKEIKKFASGNGNAQKDLLVNMFTIVFPEFSIIPKLDDICDAWFMSDFNNQYL